MSLPVVVGVEYRIVDRVKTCEQLHGDTFRSHTILVVGIHPQFLDCQSGVFRRVGIGDRVFVDVCRVVLGHCGLGKRIIIHVASVIILRQILKDAIPRVAGADRVEGVG